MYIGKGIVYVGFSFGMHWGLGDVSPEDMGDYSNFMRAKVPKWHYSLRLGLYSTNHNTTGLGRIITEKEK